MTTIAGGGSTLTQQLYQKLFDRLDANGDDAVSLDEMGSTGANAEDTAKVFKALDADGDGKVMRAEMTPSDAFGAQALSTLIDAQAESETMTDGAFIAGLMARADTDGDGALSQDELKANADLQRAAAYDAGYFTGRVMMVDDADGDGLVRPDEIKVATMKALPVSGMRFVEDLPPEELERFNAVRERVGLPLLTGPLTDEERQKRLDQLAADRAERDAAPDGAWGFLSRDLGGKRAEEGARIAEADLGDALAARLFRQILQGWSAQDPQGGAADVTA